MFSDDPDAIENLEARAAENEAKRDRMTAANRIYRSNPKNQLTEEKVQKLVALGLSEASARAGFAPDFAGRIGFPDYELANLGARIRTDRERIKHIKERQERSAQAEASPNGITVEKCQSGYVRITFAQKPARSILDALKAAGFYWGGGSWAGKGENLPAAVAEMAENKEA